LNFPFRRSNYDSEMECRVTILTTTNKELEDANRHIGNQPAKPAPIFSPPAAFSAAPPQAMGQAQYVHLGVYR
jgi:hypothetical protein